MKLLYDYLFQPSRVIQLFNHQKNWRVWWVLVGINSLISIIKYSSLDIFSLFIHAIVFLSILILTALVIDATAQLIGLKGQLSSGVFWLAFASSILWVSPSVLVLQKTFYSIGSLLVFSLNFLFLIYTWTTIKKIYDCSIWQMLAIITVPVISLIIMTISIIVYVTQIAMVI